MAAEQPQQQQPNKAGGGRFAVTCGLLRQFMKEQGGAGLLAPAVAMSLMPEADVAGAAAAPEETKTVLELFPQQAGTLKDSQQRRNNEPDQRAPLTIFYGGRMLVFDDFPAEKAQELMQLAGSSNAAGAAAVSQSVLPDMPIARKASLQRFLEKRKNRLAAADPYPATSPPAAGEPSKPVKADGAAWLGVNSRLSLS